jgi:hypothetical protein
LAATGATGLSPVHVARSGSSLRRSRATASVRASPVTTCNLDKRRKPLYKWNQ